MYEAFCIIRKPSVKAEYFYLYCLLFSCQQGRILDLKLQYFRSWFCNGEESERAFVSGSLEGFAESLCRTKV